MRRNLSLKNLNLSVYFFLPRHQIQHYTNQLAKDTSKQLRDLNEFPPEQSLDPRQKIVLILLPEYVLGIAF